MLTSAYREAEMHHQLQQLKDVYLVYVVEDHTRLRQLIVGFIDTIPGLEVIGQAASGLAALKDPLHKKADIIMTDLSMLEMTGIDLTRKLCNENPAYLIVVLTAYNETFFAEAAFQAGACAYVVKDDPSVVTDVIERVLAGEKNIVELG